MNRKIASVLSFIILLLLAWFYFSAVFTPSTNYNRSVDDFKKLSKNNNVDVLFLGSSHAFTAFNPLIVDHEIEGVSYNLGADSQLTTLSILVLEEALKFSKPKLVVLEVYYGSVNLRLTEEVKAYQLRTLDFISNISARKFEKIKTVYNSSEYLSVYSPLIRNHRKWINHRFFDLNRIKKIDENHFFYSKGYYGGYKNLSFENRMKFKDFNLKPVTIDTSETLLQEHSKQDLKQFVKFAERNDIKVLIVTSPDLRASYSNYNFFSEVKTICDSMEVDYLNLNDYYKELNLTLEDFRDPSHLNIYGGTKVSHFLGKYLNNQLNFSGSLTLNDRLIMKKNYNKFINEFILVKEFNYRKFINESFTDLIVLDSLDIIKNGRKLRFNLFLDNTKKFKNEIENYNLLVKIYPDKNSIETVGDHSKKMGWSYDKMDIKLLDIDNSINFDFITSIKKIDKIEMLLYDKIKYNGAVGNRIILDNINFLENE